MDHGTVGDVVPNIVIFYVDDLGYGDVGSYGAIGVETPNIDRLAANGVRFTDAHSTAATCTPSRYSLLLGEHGFRLEADVLDGDAPLLIQPGRPTLASMLKRAGYATAVVGKWHLGEHMPPMGFDYAEVLIGQGPYYNPPMLKNGKRTKHIGYTTDIITDLALDWLRNKRAADKPFMLMYQHKAPHRNWQPGPKHLNTYDDVMIPEPATLFDDYKGRGTPAKTQDMSIAKTMTLNDLKLIPPPRYFTPEQRKIWNAAYGPKNEAFHKANLKGKELVRWKYQRYIKDYLRCIASVDDLSLIHI